MILFTTRYIKLRLTSEVPNTVQTQERPGFLPSLGVLLHIFFPQSLHSLLHKEKPSEPSITQLPCHILSLVVLIHLFIPSTSFGPTPNKSQLYTTGFTDYVAVVGVHTHTARVCDVCSTLGAKAGGSGCTK